jgi:hypothetical protein
MSLKLYTNGICLRHIVSTHALAVGPYETLQNSRDFREDNSWASSVTANDNFMLLTGPGYQIVLMTLPFSSSFLILSQIDQVHEVSR